MIEGFPTKFDDDEISSHEIRISARRREDHRRSEAAEAKEWGGGRVRRSMMGRRPSSDGGERSWYAALARAVSCMHSRAALGRAKVRTLAPKLRSS